MSYDKQPAMDAINHLLDEGLAEEQQQKGDSVPKDSDLLTRGALAKELEG